MTMLSKLKNMAGNAAVQKVVDKIAPGMNTHINQMKELSPGQLKDEEFFEGKIIKPAWLAVSASTSGLTKLYPPLAGKFSGMMKHLRDELFVIEGDKVALTEGFQSKLPTAILEGLKK